MRASTVSIVILSALALLRSRGAGRRTADGGVVRRGALDKAAGVARSLSDCGQVDLARGAEGAARQALGRLSGALGVRRDTRDLGLMRDRRRPPARACASSSSSRASRSATARSPSRSTRTARCIHVGNGGVAATRLDTTRAREPRRGAADRAPPRALRRSTWSPRRRTSLVAEPTRARARARLARASCPCARRAATGTSSCPPAAARCWRPTTRSSASTARALTYAPNPVQQTGNTRLRDVADTDQAALTRARVAVALTDLDAGTNLLRGTYVDTALGRGRGCTLAYTPGPGVERDARPTTSPAARTRSRRPSPTRRSRASSAATSAFGFPGIFPRPVPIDVHCISDDNSFYSTADDALHMGDGGVDDAEDADVIVHEFGHATQDAQVPGFGPARHRAARDGRGLRRLPRRLHLPPGRQRRLPGRAPLLRHGVGRDHLQPGRRANAAAAACAGSTAPTRAPARTSAPTPARRTRSTTTGATGRRC